jgi:hypothetical protein
MAREKAVLRTIKEHTQVDLGLAFVPDVVNDLPGPVETKAVLIELAKLRMIELRPDGGRGRFSAAELSSAPDGPMGSKLLWTRVL